MEVYIDMMPKYNETDLKELITESANDIIYNALHVKNKEHIDMEQIMDDIISEEKLLKIIKDMILNEIKEFAEIETIEQDRGACDCYILRFKDVMKKQLNKARKKVRVVL